MKKVRGNEVDIVAKELEDRNWRVKEQIKLGNFVETEAILKEMETMIPYGTSQDQKISRKISQSLNSGHFNQPKIKEGNMIRRLTPTECERLQGFPESFKVVVPDSQVRKQAGNSVVIPMIESVAEAMIIVMRKPPTITPTQGNFLSKVEEEQFIIDTIEAALVFIETGVAISSAFETTD